MNLEFQRLEEQLRQLRPRPASPQLKSRIGEEIHRPRFGNRSRLPLLIGLAAAACLLAALQNQAWMRSRELPPSVSTRLEAQSPSGPTWIAYSRHARNAPDGWEGGLSSGPFGSSASPDSPVMPTWRALTRLELDSNN